MSSRQPPKQPGRSSSKESLKKPQEKQPTTRKTSADRGGHSGRGGATSLPSSPHNPRPTPVPSSKPKHGSSVTPRKDTVVKVKVGKPLQKDQAVAEVPVDDMPVDIEVPVAAGGEIEVPVAMGHEEIPFRRLPRGVETGQFTRRAPAGVKPVAFRPELSPRSQRVHNSAVRFLAVKREESHDQKSMETYIMEMFPKLQQTLQRVKDLSHRARAFRHQPPQSDDEVRRENDNLNTQIAIAGSVFKEFDKLLAQLKTRVNTFISRAEKGTQDIDNALKNVINDICVYSKDVKDSDIRPPEDSLGGYDGGKPDDGDGGDQGDGSGGKPGDKGDKPEDGPDGKTKGGSGGDKGDKPEDGPEGGSGGDKGDKPEDGPDGGSGGGQGGKPGDGSDGKPGDGSGGDQGGKPEGGSGGGQGNGYGGDQDGSGYGSGGDPGDGSGGDKPEDNQGGKPGGSADDDKKHADDLGHGYLGDDDYDSVISPSASESEPEFEEDIREDDDEETLREMLETLVPTMVKIGEGVKVAVKNPERAPEVHKLITKTAESSVGPLKGIFKSGLPSKLVESFEGLDPEDPQKALEILMKKFFDALGQPRPNIAESSQIEGIEGLMLALTARLEEVPKDTVSSETKLNPNVSEDGKKSFSTDGVTTLVDL